MGYKSKEDQAAKCKAYYEANKDKLREIGKLWVIKNRAKSNSYKQEWKKRNKEKYLQQQRDYSRGRTEIMGEQRRRWRGERRELFNAQQNEYKKRRKENDPRYVAECRWRAALGSLIRNGATKKQPKAKYQFGLTGAEYRLYLESLFLDGMSWENRQEWHIDHIKPLRDFDLTNHAEATICFHYLNTRPIWKADNIKDQPRRKP